jgi:subtilisin family serine protease
MTQEEKYKIISDDYMDIIIRYNNNINVLEKHENYSIHIMNEAYAVIYIPVAEVSDHILEEFGYQSIPNYYALTDEQSLDQSGVNKLRNFSTFNLRGKGVIIGIMDTGIDYLNPVFQKEDGTTKIVAIWDQTIESDNNPIALMPSFYGTEYDSEQINLALKSQNPLQIVPSTDENGHGTMLAGIAAGSEDKDNNFSGVAPDAELIVVKLKQAKNNLKNLYFIPPELPCYQENDIIWALQYILYKARSLNYPLSICIGLGTSLGAHNSDGLLNTSVTLAGDTPRVAVSVAAGNEGDLKRHFYSELDPAVGDIPVELNVGEKEYGFTMELWGDPPMIYTLGIISPSGEYAPISALRLTATQVIKFIFDATIIYINYVLIEPITGKQVIILRFDKPTSGIWKFRVFGKGDVKGAFHMWLPVNGFISGSTYFINANPFTTITSPGNCQIPITITGYNSNTGVLYPGSGRGFSTSNIINPDLAAPGVNIQAPSLNHGFSSMTGTSAAAAHTAGITALLLEWCVIDGNYPDVDSVSLKKFLIRGAKRSNVLKYPNQDWGYGIIDVFNTFNIFRTQV